MGKYSSCKHLGEKIKRGKLLSEIYYCKECGNPIIETFFDLIGYLKNPGFLRDGKFVKEKMSKKRKIEIALESTRLFCKFWKREKGRPETSGEDIEEFFTIFDFSDKSLLPFKKGEGGSEEVDEERRHEHPLYKANQAGKGSMPGKTYIKYWRWAVEANKCLKKMMRTLLDMQKILREKEINEGVGWCMLSLEGYSEEAKSQEYLLKYKPCEVREEREDGKIKIVLDCKPEKSLLFAFAFIFFISKINLMLSERELKYLCAASLKKTGCSIEEIKKITGIKNMREFYDWARLLDRFMKVCWQDERILRIPKNPEAKNLRAIRDKDGRIRFYMTW